MRQQEVLRVRGREGRGSEGDGDALLLGPDGHVLELLGEREDAEELDEAAGGLEVLVVDAHARVRDVEAARDAAELVGLCVRGRGRPSATLSSTASMGDGRGGREDAGEGGVQRERGEGRTEDARLAVVPDEARLLEHDGGRVDDVGALLLEERVVFAVARVDAVERRRAEHADVQVRVAEPATDEARGESVTVAQEHEHEHEREEERKRGRTTGRPRRGCGRCRGRSRR